jgi:hypothetical protein
MGQWHDYLKKTDKDGPWFLTGKLAEHVMGVVTRGIFDRDVGGAGATARPARTLNATTRTCPPAMCGLN